MEQLDQYKNNNGTYNSPRNGKQYKTLKSFRAHWYYKGHVDSDTLSKRLKNVECQFCKKEVISSNIRKHEESCYLNPSNTKFCEVCGSPIKNYKTSKGTCSRSCSNTYFRSGENNVAYKGTHYTQICFDNHKKECIVCGENKIVAVHHNDHNHYNNDPVNLIPLCPTHHQYVHSRYKEEVQPIIDEYIGKWIQGVA